MPVLECLHSAIRAEHQSDRWSVRCGPDAPLDGPGAMSVGIGPSLVYPMPQTSGGTA